MSTTSTTQLKLGHGWVGFAISFGSDQSIFSLWLCQTNMLNRYLTMMHFAIPFLVCLCSLNGLEASAKDSAADAGFQEQPIEFRNGDVKLAGSLLLPTSDVPVPAVIFVHGAGPQTRESYREVGEHFVSQGVAALIYDRRGTGQSGGVYESYAPYENLVNDAIAGVGFLIRRRNHLTHITS
jgi:hypothetical protein